MCPTAPTFRASNGDAESRLERALADLERERRAVGEIQQLLLPATLPLIPGFEVSAFYRPSEHASGDYYDVVPLIDEQWGLVLADVAGHGTPAAVIMAVLRTLIHAELPVNRDKPAGEFLERVNRVMCDTYLRGGMFVAVWAAVLDPFARRLRYACAGHPPPRLIRQGRVIDLGSGGGLPLGVEPSAAYGVHDLALEDGDLLVMYTDGITEVKDPRAVRADLFGTARLDRVLLECGSETTRGCAERVTRALAQFSEDAAPADDQTMMVVRVGRAPGSAG